MQALWRTVHNPSDQVAHVAFRYMDILINLEQSDARCTVCKKFLCVAKDLRFENLIVMTNKILFSGFGSM
jgi:hypothetical protein